MNRDRRLFEWDTEWFSDRVYYCEICTPVSFDDTGNEQRLASCFLDSGL